MLTPLPPGLATWQWWFTECFWFFLFLWLFFCVLEGLWSEGLTNSSSPSDYLGGIKFWFNYCSCSFQFIYSSLLVEFLSSPFLNNEFCHQTLIKLLRKITKTNNNNNWRKKISELPLPGCMSWRKRSEHCQFGIFSHPNHLLLSSDLKLPLIQPIITPIFFNKF